LAKRMTAPLVSVVLPVRDAALLIVKNADVTAKDVEGQTPLDW